MNSTLPKDPMILLSVVNTKLRDQYASLRDFCEDAGVDPNELAETLAAVGYRYDEKTNRFR